MTGVPPGPCHNPQCRCDPCACGETCRCGLRTDLGDLERQVMEVVWTSAAPDLTRRQVAGALPAYAPTTIGTVLDRLSRKGLVRRTLDGRTARFAPVATQADRTAEVMRRALEDAGDPAEAAACFVRSMPAAEARTLRRALARRART